MGDYTTDFTNNSAGSDTNGKEDGINLLLGVGAVIGPSGHRGIHGELEFYEGNDYKVDLTTLEGNAFVFVVTLGIVYEI